MLGRRLDKITQEVRNLKKFIDVLWVVFVMAFGSALIWSPVLLIDDFKAVMEFTTFDGFFALALEEHFLNN